MFYLLYDSVDKDYGFFCDDDTPKASRGYASTLVELTKRVMSTNVLEGCNNIDDFIIAMNTNETYKVSIHKTWPSYEHFKTEYPEYFI